MKALLAGDALVRTARDLSTTDGRTGAIAAAEGRWAAIGNALRFNAADASDAHPTLCYPGTMPVSPKIQQHPTQVVSLEGWLPDEEFPYGPQGAKPKRIFVCPNPPPFGFLIGGHRYLFKEPSGSCEQQIWSEVIAYELSRDILLPVPPAFLALAPGNGSPGVLVEFFYGHPFDPETRFVHAIERLQGLQISTDYSRGSLKDNITLCRLHHTPSWRTWWARTLAFDAVIGNVYLLNPPAGRMGLGGEDRLT